MWRKCGQLEAYVAKHTQNGGSVKVSWGNDKHVIEIEKMRTHTDPAGHDASSDECLEISSVRSETTSQITDLRVSQSPVQQGMIPTHLLRIHDVLAIARALCCST